MTNTGGFGDVLSGALGYGGTGFGGTPDPAAFVSSLLSAFGVDPASMGYGGYGAPAPGPVATDPTLRQYLNISNWAYSQGENPPPGQLEFLDVNGRAVQKLDNETGFYGAAVVTKQGNVVIGFEGTNLFTGDAEFTAAQIEADGEIYLGHKAESFDTALAFAKRAIRAAVAQGYDRSDIFLTGHSLGAAQAEFVSARLGLEGTTFGTPGISTTLTDGQPALLKNYVEAADPVGNYAFGSPLGTIVDNDTIKHFGDTSIIGTDPLGLLPDAAEEYAKGTPEGYAAALADLIEALPYHSLSRYAQDLGVTLKGSDMSIAGKGPDSTEAIEKLADAFFQAAFPPAT